MPMTLKFPSQLTYVKEASKKVLDSLRDLKLNASELTDIRLCFEEAFINAVKYGNQHNKDLDVEVEVVKSPAVIELTVRDQGKGFDYKNYEDPTEEKNLTKTHGRGVFLIKKLMDEVTFENNGSTIRMKKSI